LPRVFPAIFAKQFFDEAFDIFGHPQFGQVGLIAQFGFAQHRFAAISDIATQ
jgi:hypothetical protein